MFRRSLLALTPVAAATVALVAAPAIAATRAKAASHAKAAPLRTGDYVCQAAGAGMFPLSVLSGMRYKAAGPSGRYTTRAGLIYFSRGSLSNQVGKLVSPTNFELAMDKASPAYTTCNLAEKTN